jgi:hypothetical protein
MDIRKNLVPAAGGVGARIEADQVARERRADRAGDAGLAGAERPCDAADERGNRGGAGSVHVDAEVGAQKLPLAGIGKVLRSEIG